MIVSADKLETTLVNIRLYDSTTDKAYLISDIVTDLDITTYIEDNAGKCTFNIVLVPGLTLHEGSTVDITVDKRGVFKGYLFSIKMNNDRTTAALTFYDLLRYLKNEDSYVFKNLTSSNIFAKLCQDMVLPYRVVDASTHICTPRSNDGKALYTMIKTSLHDTLVNSGKWYVVRDNYGTLEHVAITSLSSGVLLTDTNGLNNVSYEQSIDANVYNQIKLYKDNTKTKKREVYIVNDTINGGTNLKRWGLLQLYKQVDESLNKAQIEQFARKLLYLYNAPKKKLKLECAGTFDVTAGSIIQCKIRDFFNGDNLDSYFVVTSCTHKLSKNEHQMSLNVEVY